MQQVGDPNLVALRDHRPVSIVSGEGASRDMPISTISADAAVTDRAAGSGWRAGLHPSPGAPVWPLESFRDRFLTWYGS